MENKRGLGLLFDLSFTEFITTRIIKIIFVLGIIFSAIGALAVLFGAFSRGFGAGVLALIYSPILFLLWVLGSRIWCELIIVMFRIAENTSRMVKQNSPELVD